MMPVMDGYGFLEAVRADPFISATPFIFLTALTDKSEISLGMKLGADDYLTKPFTTHQLLAAVLTAFRKRELIKQSVREENLFDVFLSYSRKDVEIMHRVKDYLYESKYKVWTDENLEPGTSDWEQAIGNTIKYTKCLVVILSPDSEKSKWVGRELALAETLGIRIFPILARGDERVSVPFRLISNQWIDARQDANGALETLVNAIHKHINRI